MSRMLPLVAAQSSPRPLGEPLSEFAREVEDALVEHPEARLAVYPELHLFGDGQPDQQRTEVLQESAEPLDGPRVAALTEMAGDLGIWLVPGSVCERGDQGQLFNTQIVLSPSGELHGFYRKVFPWRPYEPYDPGDRFTTVDLEGIGRVGLSICYDAWFPEVSRQLAWMGAEVILNVVKTTTPDRAQELVLARANAIVNQVFMVSVNCAGPDGMGDSLIVDPEGLVMTHADGPDPTTLFAELDLTVVDKVRANGTAGLNRMWSQFTDADAAIDLPVYQGRIHPASWTPSTPTH